MLFDGKPTLTTIELPWRDNKPLVSCIPHGDYEVAWGYGAHLGEALELLAVPDRTGIFIHVANFASELLGCIGVGLSFGELNGFPAVRQSKLGLDRLKTILGDQKSFPLSIRWCA